MTVEALIVLDDQMKDFIFREGTMPTVIDFTDASSVDANVATFVSRGKNPSLMMEQPRVFVAIDPLLFGLLRLYGTHQDIRGETPPTIVRSLAEAFETLEAANLIFQPIALSSTGRDPEDVEKECPRRCLSHQLGVILETPSPCLTPRSIRSCLVGHVNSGL